MSLPPPPTDGEIVAAVLDGQTEQFSGLVERYERALLQVAVSRLGRRDWAEDAVQEAFLWAFRSLHTYDSQFSFRTWLWTILLNQCRRQYAKHARAAELAASGEEAGAWNESEHPAESSPGPAAALLAKERREELELRLAQLPEVQADALRLRFFAGLKFHEIAAAMACSLNSAKMRVKGGLLKLAAGLRGESTATDSSNEMMDFPATGHPGPA